MPRDLGHDIMAEVEGLSVYIRSMRSRSDRLELINARVEIIKGIVRSGSDEPFPPVETTTIPEHATVEDDLSCESAILEMLLGVYIALEDQHAIPPANRCQRLTSPDREIQKFLDTQGFKDLLNVSEGDMWQSVVHMFLGIIAIDDDAEDEEDSDGPAGDSPDCSICLSRIRKTRGYVSLDCRHVFHFRCILGWMESQIVAQVDYTCPMCRALIVFIHIKRTYESSQA